MKVIKMILKNKSGEHFNSLILIISYYWEKIELKKVWHARLLPDQCDSKHYTTCSQQ